MRGKTVFTFVMVAALSLTSIAAERTTERPARPGRAEGPAAERQAVAQERMAQRFQRQMEQIKAEHQGLIDELRAIHTMAVKEKATQTAERIEQLISKRQEKLQASVRGLEQQRERFLRATKERAGRVEGGPRRGRRAPDFELDSFDGKTVKLSDYKGRIVVLEWLNFECPFSIYHYQTTTTMVDLAKKYQDKEVVWLTINSTNHTQPEQNRAFAEKYKLPFPILDDRPGRVGRLYGARTTPHMFIIDKDGYVVYNGAIDSAPLGKPQAEAGKVNYVDKALSELTSGQNVSLPTTPPYGCTVKYAK